MKNEKLANRVKELRKRKGLTQEDLTESSGLSLRTIQRIENGETEPTGDTLKKISHSLNITPDELIDWTLNEDRSFLKALNLSALTFIFFPLLGILIPLILWISKKDKLKDINKIARDVINFEISWTILLFLGFMLNTFFLTNIFNETTDVSPSLIMPHLRFKVIFFIGMYLFNFTIIIINQYLINKGKDTKYYPKIQFLRK